MRNLKKLFAVVMVVAMLASMMVPALAAGVEYEDEATILQDLGLFQGYGAGELGLADDLTREQGLALMLRVMGLEDEVKAMTEEEVAAELARVVDPETVTATWAKPYVAYAVKNGLTKGIDASILPNVKFAGQLKMTGKEFINLMLNGMGYATAWDDVLTKAAEVEMLSAGESVTFGTVKEMTRDDAVAIMTGALTGITSEGISLAQALVNSGAVDADKMEEYGFIVPEVVPTEAPVEFAVEDATALNLKQIAIVFNKSLDKDSAQEAKNYSLKGKYKLQDDGVTVIGTLDVAAANQSSKDLTIKGVEDVDGYEIAKTEVKINFLDMTIPEATDAEVIGKDTIKVKFTEPLNVDTGNNSALRKGFALKDANGKNVYVNKVTFNDNLDSANVKFYSDFKEGVYALTVNNEFKDFAGYTVVKKDFDLEVVPDEEGPEVIGYESAKPYEVTLVFNEDIEIVNSSLTDKDDAPYFYHTNSKSGVKGLGKAGEVNVEDSGNKLKFVFDDKTEMPSGTVYVYIAKGAIRDLWGNKNDQQIMIAVEVEGDNEAPYVEKVEASKQNELEVTFNEKLQKAAAEKRDNYTLLDKDGKEIKSIIRSASLDDKVVKLTLRSDISGEHTLVVEGVKDQYKNEMAKQSILFDVEDQTDPDFAKFKASLHGADKDVQTLIINFDDVMATDGVYSVLDLEKYRVQMEKYVEKDKAWNNIFEYVELADIDDDIDISISDDGKKVEIELDTEDAGYRFAEDKWIQIARVADAAGNKTVALSGQVKIGGVGFVAVDKYEAVAKDELKLVLKSALADFAEEDYIIFVEDDAEKEIIDVLGDIAVDEERNSDGNTVIIFRLLDEELNADGTFTWTTDEVEYTSPVFIRLRTTDDTAKYEIKSKDAYGAKVAFLDENDDPIALAFKDKIAPELYAGYDDDKDDDDYIEATENVITLHFDEALKTVISELAATDLIVEADGDVLDAGIDYSVVVEADTIEITLMGDFLTFDGLVTVSTAKDVKYIKDANDNKLAEIDAEEIEVATTPRVDNIKASVTDTVYNQAVITFNEEMDIDTLVVYENFEFEFDENMGVNLSVNDDGDKLTISFYKDGLAEPVTGDKIKITEKVTDYSGTKIVPVTFTYNKDTKTWNKSGD